MQLESLLATGAVYEVWSAVEPSGRRLALKRPTRAWARRPEALGGLRREAEVLTSVRHPAVALCYGLCEHGGSLALATELLDGGDLVALAGAHSRHWQAAYLAVLGALRALHGAGWAHRDVKARNVLLDADGRARLIDLASAARLGAPRGSGGLTCGHARPAPRDAPVCVADDAYAAAALLLELARGPLPAREVPGEIARREIVLAALTPAVLAALEAANEPDPGSLSRLLNVIESVTTSRT